MGTGEPAAGEPAAGEPAAREPAHGNGASAIRTARWLSAARQSQANQSPRRSYTVVTGVVGRSATTVAGPVCPPFTAVDSAMTSPRGSDAVSAPLRAVRATEKPSSTP